MQDEALLGTYLLPQATMHTATFDCDAHHIRQDPFVAGWLQELRGRLHHWSRSRRRSKATNRYFPQCSASEIDVMFFIQSSTRARKESLRVRMYFTSWEISSANLCSPARYVLECIASISGYKEVKNEREQGQSLTNEKDRKICHSLGSGVVDFFSRLHCVRWGLGLLQGAGHCRQMCWAAG